jgi:hypothetical protein
MLRVVLYVCVTTILLVEANAQANPAFPTAIAQKYSAEPARQARLRTCRDQLEVNKIARGNDAISRQREDAYLNDCVRRLAKQAAASALAAVPAKPATQPQPEAPPNQSAAAPNVVPLGTGCQEPPKRMVESEKTWGQGCPLVASKGLWRYWCPNGETFELSVRQPTPEGGPASLCERGGSSASMSDRNTRSDIARFGNEDGGKWTENRNARATNGQAQSEAVSDDQSIPEQRTQSQRADLRQKLFADYGIEMISSVSELAANPFAFRGLTIGVSVSFARMLSESEALFSSNGELIVARVPSTMFRGNESVLLAAKVVGLKSTKLSAGGETPLPYVEFAGAWRLDEKRGETIRVLRKAHLLATDITDGQIALSIEQAIYAALPPMRRRAIAGATEGFVGRSPTDGIR